MKWPFLWVSSALKLKNKSAILLHPFFEGFSTKMIRHLFAVLFVILIAWWPPVFAAEKTNTEKDTPGSPSQPSLSIDDLGFSKEQTQSDPQFQKDLETRTDMLKIHQTLGLITAVPMATEFVLGIATAGNVSNGSSDTGLHTTLGLATVALYGTTALFEILAPKPKGLKPSGNTEVHEALSWIHLPLMILVPLVGDMINDRIANHQPIGNLGLVHGTMATTLLASYLASRHDYDLLNRRIMKIYLACLFALLGPSLGFAGEPKEQWLLEKSVISYVVTHPLHVVRGKSLSAREKVYAMGETASFGGRTCQIL